MKRRSVTIKDVAQAAGVSRATAARALGDYGYSSGPVRDAVMKAAEELGYSPSRMAKAMRNGRSHLIGFVSADITDGLFSEALGGICRVAETAGYQVVVLNSSDKLDDEITGITTLLSHGVEGLIVSPVIVSHSEHLTEAEQTVPIVCVDRVPSGLSGVVSDNEGAGRKAAARAVEQGHRRIGLVASVQSEEPVQLERSGSTVHVVGADRPSVLRVRGFVDELQNSGLGIDESQVCLIPHPAGNTFALVSEWLDEHSDLTAIVAADSYQARHLYRALRERKRSIPDDVSILVFSDDEWTQFVSPAVDTISLDGGEMGARAAEALLREIEGESGDRTVESIPTIYRPGGSINRIKAPDSAPR
ncbi:LacI family DNA-binding transcriptional regulator [Brevibacterium sp.]|uniref:LacI family DNA-binding transcriptional regulator n=1 Tax=Brevibacterium sp. TaxID=1701 RepID=UPI002811E5DB|nr:LacI family DNA-binding transcriptional regulator [Brevibacterium sp.]